MSSTSNVQNLLTNVFRPSYQYDTVNQLYSTKLEMANIDTITANSVSVFTAAVGDSNSNVYVGVGAGNSFSNATSKVTSNNVAIGSLAGTTINHASNSVFLGYNAGANAVTSVSTVSIGAASKGDGSSNVYIGAGAGPLTGVGSNNIFIGAGVTTATAPTSNLKIGSAIVADMTNKYFGIWNATPTHALDVNGDVVISTPAFGGHLGINTDPGSYNFKVIGNFYASDGNGALELINPGSSNSVLSFTNVMAGGQASVRGSGGFFSVQGTTASIATNGTAIIGTWQKGGVDVYIKDVAGINNYLAQRFFCLNATDGQAVYRSTDNTTYNVSIVTSGSSNITITNSASSNVTYTYTIIYFPVL